MPILEQLIAGRHIGTYAFFFLSGEGVLLPRWNRGNKRARDRQFRANLRLLDGVGHQPWRGTLSQRIELTRSRSGFKVPEYRGARDAVGLGS